MTIEANELKVFDVSQKISEGPTPVEEPKTVGQKMMVERNRGSTSYMMMSLWDLRKILLRLPQRCNLRIHLKKLIWAVELPKG